MFYSHEVLSQRKYGVATVWLVATLGTSKTSLQRVSRKQIVEVDVDKACETITQPQAPMALRLQSNLMYGVTRVYAQQWAYVMGDAESTHKSMRTATFHALRASLLDAESGSKARANNLILHDDPNFYPELDLGMAGLELTNLRMGTSSPRLDSMLSPQSSRSRSKRTTSLHSDVGGLVFPHAASSSLGGDPVRGSFGRLNAMRDSGAGSAVRGGLFEQQDQEGLLDDLGLVIEDDGNIVMEDTPTRQRRANAIAMEEDAATAGNDGAASGGGPPQSATEPVQNAMDRSDEQYFAPVFEDEPMQIEPGEVSVERQTIQREQSTTSESAAAPLRHRPRPPRKVLKVDSTTELHTREFKRWNDEYLDRMSKSIHEKENKHAKALAKKNAEFWMLGAGQQEAGPLDDFKGLKLLEALTGLKLTAGAVKRTRSESDSSGSERRVRNRSEVPDEEIGHGAAVAEEDGFMPVFDEEVELGRAQPTPIDDIHQSSMFPWHQSTDSRRPTGVFGAAISSSAGGGTHLPPLPRRGSRLTSASPLVGRGVPVHSEEIAGGDVPVGALDELTILGGDDTELYAGAGDIDAQTAAESQVSRLTLDGESDQFLEFVKGAIQELDGGEREMGDDDLQTRSIAFEELLLPAENSCIVAAQGFVHMLALGSKNLLRVEQIEAFGPINLLLV